MRLISITIILFSFLVLPPLQAQSIERDIEQGEEANEQIKQQIGVYEHPANIYLDSIGERLVSNLEDRIFDYRFGILDMPEPNALALPGGYVYFSRGILVLANSEDELAGVMGHEAIHVHKRHSRKANNTSIFTGILKIPGAIVGAFSPVAGGILMTPFAMMDAGYSRKHEKQADEMGVELAAKSGYDPDGLINILDKMLAQTELETGEEEMRSFFRTHPYTPKRVDNINKTISKLDRTDTPNIVTNHKAFLDKLEGILIGDNPAYGVFHDSLFIHPELNFTIVYPKGWKGINTPQAVGLMPTDKEAQLMFSITDTLKSPEKLASEFKEYYAYYYQHQPFRSEALNINGFPGHILSYTGYSDGIKLIFSMLWMKWGNHTFQFVSLSTETYSDVIESIAKSLHEMAEVERSMISQTVLHIVKAKEGESLNTFSARTNNVLDLDYTAIINNLQPNEMLSEGRWMKIGVVRKY